MKQTLFYFLVTSLILLTSCSSEENDSDLVLPKTINYFNTKTSTDSLVKISYNGNKIKSLVGEGGRTEFEYKEDFIVKQTTYFIEDGVEIKFNEYLYSYENGKLASVDYSQDISKSRFLYTYKDNGVVAIKSYYKYGNEPERESSQEFTFANGNLVKGVYHYTENNTGEVEFEYDTNNNPFKNVLGYSLLMTKDLSSINNIVKTISTDLVKGSIVDVRNYETEYVYNNQGYPVKMISNYNFPDKIIEYFY